MSFCKSLAVVSRRRTIFLGVKLLVLTSSPPVVEGFLSSPSLSFVPRTSGTPTMTLVNKSYFNSPAVVVQGATAGRVSAASTTSTTVLCSSTNHIEPTTENKTTTTTTTAKKVVIVGAGPAGLLAAIKFLRRNENTPNKKYQVTLIDPGIDLGKLDRNDFHNTKKRKRSWMVTLSGHGLSAIQSVDGLYENYISGFEVDVKTAVLSLNANIKFDLDASGEASPAFKVFDRNFVCAGLAKYLNDKYNAGKEAMTSIQRSAAVSDDEVDHTDVSEDLFISHYHSKAMFVDYEKKRVLVRNEKEDHDFYLDYDLIIGCDGIRSIVRNGLASTDRNFECSIRDTLGMGKAFQVKCPPDVKPGTIFLIINALPKNMVAFALPQKGGMLNVNIGLSSDQKNKIDPILLSNDVDGISSYFKKHFYAFEIDCDDVARQWANQGWNTISQLNCNIYHNKEHMILIMGDAAHAASPHIAQGMNTALADVAVLDKILDENEDDLCYALEAFSEERVKEGNALTVLSSFTSSSYSSPTNQFQFVIGSMIRVILHRVLPNLYGMDPLLEDIAKGGRLSAAYEKMCEMGVIKKSPGDLFYTYVNNTSSAM